MLLGLSGATVVFAMINLSQETEALARRLATAQSTTVDDAVRQALEERARAVGVIPQPQRPRDQSAEAIAARRGRIDRIVHEIATLPVLDRRSPSDIMDDLNAL
jgi:antitoxin VapB